MACSSNLVFGQNRNSSCISCFLSICMRWRSMHAPCGLLLSSARGLFDPLTVRKPEIRIWCQFPFLYCLPSAVKGKKISPLV